MTQVPVEIPETVSGSGGSRRFVDLRGVQWRVDLGILPSSPSSSIDDLRRVTANSRRRYAALRRQLLVDTHVPKDGSNSPDLVMDNPLSQNPDSMWGRFFKNAELERMIDQDLARLYPERGSYFQSSECQGMLRRMLLLWCLRHPEYGYRQGMHELLAPLLYVLHVDVERLSEVRKAHEDHFADKFDSFSFHENDLTYKFDFKKFSESSENWNGFEKNSGKSGSPSERDPEIQTIVLLTDAYGAEGDLGIVISDKFMEHDAYSMFDALMNGAGGVVAMAEFFSPLTFSRANTGIPPVIEASGSLYHLLSVVDSSLHSHLIELGVEPQYFALRWLRVLFGREFYLEDLLVIWDEIFSHENAKFIKATDSNEESYSGVLCSSRGGFISAFAVSMMLNLRSSLLATNNATTCLQRLLNFSDTVNLVKLIKKAKSLQGLAVEANKSNSLIIHSGLHDSRKSTNHRGHSLSLDLAASPQTSLNMVPVKILRGAFKMKGWLNPPTDESTGETNKAPKPPLVVEASTHESSIVGFYEQFSQIKNWLTDSTHDRLQVLNIVGMAGIGKTTLARILFEPAATDYKFKIHVWASPSVSRTNNVQTVIRGILDSIRPKEDEVLDDKSIEQLTGILHRSLKGMRYLIVLDDVWDIQLWDDIKTSFPDDYTRSRIILTTRLTEMDFEDQLCRTHRMRLLTPNYSWTLFCMKVFGEEKCPQELKYDAKHISGNCGGLPLAIVVIGGLLSKVSRNKDDWQLIASSTNSMVTSTEELKEILSLGYKYLPLHLRACFRYMIIFLVEDYELAVARLVRLWIDEGLVDQLGSKSLEEVADEYLKDLIDRGLVMVCKRNENGDAETCGISSIWKDYFMAENPDILQYHLL
ncbi:uncharacterized protein [Henckelia pumila]|uniref:uncharacterized protein isoform X2 n=1 Tax=Henckelia pumila TaxID=405737 RepID=UPI003C6DF93F